LFDELNIVAISVDVLDGEVVVDLLNVEEEDSDPV
jgi:ribonuclease PH